MISAGGEALLREPRRDPPPVLHCERVNDAAAGQLRKIMRHPRQALGLVVEPNVEQFE